MDKIIRLLKQGFVLHGKPDMVLEKLRLLCALEYDKEIPPTDAELWERRN